MPEKEAVKGKELGRTGREELKKGEGGAGTAPLYLAVYALDRDRLQRFLTEHNIYAPVLWPVGKENEGCLTEDEKYIFGHMLALPMDQRYGRKAKWNVKKVQMQRNNRSRRWGVGWGIGRGVSLSRSVAL